MLTFNPLRLSRIGDLMVVLRNRCPSEDASPQEWTLHRRITTVGSAPDNDICLDSPGVDDHHATITCEGGQFVLRPESRKSTLRVDGKKVRRNIALEHDVEVDIGGVDLEFQLLEDRSLPEYGDDPADRRLRGFHHMHQLSLQLLGARHLDELLEGMLDSALELTGGDKGFVVLSSDNDGEHDWEIHIARQIDEASLCEGGRHLSDSVLRHVVDTGEPVVVSDASRDDQFRDAHSVINLQLASVLCVPLLERGELLGVLYVGNDSVTGLFDDIDLELLSIFAAKMSLLISNASLLEELRRDNASLRKKLRDQRFGSLIGSSDAMQPVFHAIDRVAPTDVTILITGETGTGKELVAGELHRRSNRGDGPFITINCGAIPESLLESELFGHEKGAFTGAAVQKDGKFHAADGGTIFLDEMGEMPLQLQVKLLRVIQERSFTRVGSNTPENVDIRILAATNRDLDKRVEEGEFREDLYYRLNVVEIALPPLRNRGGDIVMIARFLIDKISDDLDVAPRELDAGALRAIRRFDWPGNIRQLENRLKKALVLSTGSKLSAEDLDLSTDALPEVQTLAQAKESFALDYVLSVLEQNGGNRTQTARDLGVDPRTVFRYLEKASSS